MYNISYLKNFKEVLKSGEILLGTMIEQLEGPKLVKVLEESGYNFFFIDCEHGAYSLESVSNMVIAADFSKIVPFARVPEIRKEAILKVLDLGTGGIMIPAVKTAEEVREAVRLAKYKPMGNRGYSTYKYYSNYSMIHPAKILKEANEGQIIVIQIETREAIDCISDIAAVEGVDALLVGPGDLSLSYGYPGEQGRPEVVSAVEKVIKAAKERNLGIGIHCGSMDDLIFWKNKGMNMLMWSCPLAMVHNFSRITLKAIKEG